MTDQPIRFEELQLIDPILQALHREGYTEPTPIQRQAIPHVLQERDLLGCAQTGTGKTAAFALPILQLLAKRPAASVRAKLRVLVLTPTRELAAQIGESFERYGANLGLRSGVIFGGVGQGAQVSALRDGIDILVATPGRLLDLIEQRHVDLGHLEIFVLDEADRMLDMGFIHDVRRVLKLLPAKRQSLFFSATMPPDIQRLARDILSDPVRVEVTPVATTAEKIDQSLYFVEKEGKRGLLEHLLLKDDAIRRALVFTRTKHGADKVAKFLNQAGVTAAAIHGNKSQNNRIRALNSFKEGEIRVLVATDIAARGIDIDGVTHVVNFDLPNIPESYVHRIGRTARAGAEGESISFCDREERAYLRDIERLIRMKVRVVESHPFATSSAGNADAVRPDPAKRAAIFPARASAPHSARPSQGGGGRHGRGGRNRDRGHHAHAAAPAASRSSSEARPSSHRGGSRPGAAKGARPQGHGGGQRRGQGSAHGSSGRSGGGHARPPRESTGQGPSSSSGEKKPWWKRIVGGK